MVTTCSNSCSGKRHDLLELQTNPLPAWQSEVRASLYNASIADCAPYPGSVYFYDPPGRSTADSISISLGNGHFGQIARSCRRTSRSKVRSRRDSKSSWQSLSLLRCDACEGWRWLVVTLWRKKIMGSPCRTSPYAGICGWT